MAFRISAELEGHTADVRGLAAQGSDLLVSVSRDGTGRVWKREGAQKFGTAGILIGHSGYVTSVAIVPSTAEHPHGQIATGGADGRICVWDAEDLAAPTAVLEGHKDNVCALAASTDGNVLVSGSWDGTARVWTDGKCTHTLTGHAAAVWDVLVLADGAVLTASADRQIRRWEEGKLRQTYSGHSDCVRALAALPGGGFASAANDSTVREWTANGTCRAVLQGHTSFVYTLATAADGALVSGGEDRAVRVWRDGALVHTIMIPATSVWAVAALANGDVACGSDDGRVRVFSRDAQRTSDTALVAAFEKANAGFAISAKTLGDVETVRPERLESPGSHDQQVVMVRDGSAVSAHQWDAPRAQWLCVGHVVDAAGPAHKQKFEGREYDYVFDVDIQEGAPPLKLPYNATENPYTAARRFLERNDLPLEHLDTVANFIIKNADAVQLGTDTQQVADPFTGASRYVPADAPTAASFVPPADFIINWQANGSAIIAKFVEFNTLLAQAPATAALSLDDDAMQMVRALQTSLGAAADREVKVSDNAYAALLQAALRWPADRRFPALDLLRLAVAASPLPAKYRTDDGRDLIACIVEASGIFELAASSDAPTRTAEVNAMMGVRALANAFATSPGINVVWAARTRILDALDGVWARVANKNLIVAMATLFLNLSIAAARMGDDDDGLDILSAASRFLNSTDNPDAQLRLVNVFGVLAAKFQLCKDSARVLGDETIVILGIQGKSDAVKKAAQEVGAFLSA
ncbi:PFU-domain-containing protein [Coemansia reversa NRRL 1564]|uniref:PFU-domain-containing protein n=1 Tax=Coemansia reversa (strain ATCC 12441 / NRRL 1564) TaxID=763665 RepID=A0A2G5BCR3_COERN|nr:PFU-domain-containing protein [Coemansia reversa NRRL 1564]|eukprot:PIA16772.1 PFU-domain-containing protein [Coemansia reversa NRRL 1564]